MFFRRLTVRPCATFLGMAIVTSWGAAALPASAQTVMFEGVPQSNVSPTSPYSESGFTFTSTNAQSAVFPAGGTFFPGDATGFLGFAGGNTITLTADNGGPFSIQSLLVGQTTLSTASSADVTVTGFFFGGGSASTTFSGLTAATPETVNYNNVTSVSFSATTDSGIDNVVLTVSAAEPGDLCLLAMAALPLGAGLARRRRTL
jgi:hypothetical protein